MRQTPCSILPALLGLLVLCGSAPAAAATAAADVDPAGAYTLVSVDGKPVPAAVKHGETAMTVKEGTFVIDAGGTCVSRIVFSLPNGKDSASEVKATWTRKGSTLTMKWERAGTTTGTVDGRTFTMNNEGMVFLYRR